MLTTGGTHAPVQASILRLEAVLDFVIMRVPRVQVSHFPPADMAAVAFGCIFSLAALIVFIGLVSSDAFGDLSVERSRAVYMPAPGPAPGGQALRMIAR